MRGRAATDIDGRGAGDEAAGRRREEAKAAEEDDREDEDDTADGAGSDSGDDCFMRRGDWLSLPGRHER